MRFSCIVKIFLDARNNAGRSARALNVGISFIYGTRLIFNALATTIATPAATQLSIAPIFAAP